MRFGSWSRRWWLYWWMLSRRWFCLHDEPIDIWKHLWVCWALQSLSEEHGEGVIWKQGHHRILHHPCPLRPEAVPQPVLLPCGWGLQLNIYDTFWWWLIQPYSSLQRKYWREKFYPGGEQTSIQLSWIQRQSQHLISSLLLYWWRVCLWPVPLLFCDCIDCFGIVGILFRSMFFEVGWDRSHVRGAVLVPPTHLDEGRLDPSPLCLICHQIFDWLSFLIFRRSSLR